MGVGGMRGMTQGGGMLSISRERRRGMMMKGYTGRRGNSTTRGSARLSASIRRIRREATQRRHIKCVIRMQQRGGRGQRGRGNIRIER